MPRLFLALVAFVAMFVSSSAAQDVNVIVPATGDAYWTVLAFSRDGRILREFASISPAAAGQSWEVRVITYRAATGQIIHQENLPPDTRFDSATSDGRTAVIFVDKDPPEARRHFFLLDTDTGETQDIPSAWLNPNDGQPSAAISGDGRLVSTFSDSGPEESPLIVTVYDWQTKKQVARQMAGLPAGGGSDGGVTADGKIEFSYSRSGSDIVDPKTGRLLVQLGTDAFRSADGTWIVEFPFQPYVDPENWPKEVTIKDGENGRVLGRLELELTDDPANAMWRGAFCGPSGRFVAASNDAVLIYQIPSGKRIARFPAESWREAEAKGYPAVTVACSWDGKRIAIRSGARLTLRDVK